MNKLDRTDVFTLDQIKEWCAEFFYDIPIRASRGARHKNRDVAEFCKKLVNDRARIHEIRHYPQNLKDMVVRIVRPDNKFGATRFGLFFFVDNQMYIITEDKSLAKSHYPQVHQEDQCLEVFNDSKTFTVPVLFAGIYTGFNDINGVGVFTGDLVKSKHCIAGVGIMSNDFQHIYDNHCLRLSSLSKMEVITTLFYKLRRNVPEVDIEGLCCSFAQSREGREKLIQEIKELQLYNDMPEEYVINLYENNPDNTARFALGYTNYNPLIVIGVNPSTADDTKADQTIRRVRGYVCRNGFNGFIMINLYPQRSPFPSELDDSCKFSYELHNENLKQIENAIKGLHKPTVLVAFGDTITTRDYLPSCFNDIINLCLRYGAEFKTIGYPTKKVHPRHPSRGKYQPLRDLCTMSYLAELGVL